MEANTRPGGIAIRGRRGDIASRPRREVGWNIRVDGFEEIPLAIGLVYQFRKSSPGEDDDERRLFLHLSFDMSLLNL